MENILLILIFGFPYYCPILAILPLIISFVYANKHNVPATSMRHELLFIPLLFLLNLLGFIGYFKQDFRDQMDEAFFAMPLIVCFSVILWFNFLFRKIITKIKPDYSQKKITITLWSIFLCFAITANIIFIPSFITLENHKKTQTALENGDVQTLLHLYKGGCPPHQTNMEFVSKNYPIDTIDYLLACLKNNNSKRQFSQDLLKILTSDTPQTYIPYSKTISEIFQTYYSDITLQDKQQLINTFKSQLETYELGDNEDFVTAILYILSKNTELGKLFLQNPPKISNDTKDWFLQRGNKDMPLLVTKYKLETSKQLDLALYVLNHQIIELKKLLETHPEIAKEVIYLNNDDTYSHYRKPVPLAVYSFQYGNYDIINYFIQHNLISPTDYNYHYESEQTKSDYCQNPLYYVLYTNPNIRDEKQKEKIKKYLIDQHACNDNKHY